jgi:hypothetical protein
MQSPQLAALEAHVAPLRRQLEQHPLYRSIHSLQDLHCFMESHIFAVWDFMALLKALQRRLTCVDVPWVPSAFPQSRRLINEIVLGEESDEYQGRFLSHFELYLEAMQQAGASTQAMRRTLQLIANNERVGAALTASNAPQAAQDFVAATYRLIHRATVEDKLHCIAAAFTFGREGLIPDMFRSFVRGLNQQMGGQNVSGGQNTSLELFVHYLERHIEVDGDSHGPMALRMIAELCGSGADAESQQRWQEAAEAVEEALTARLALWDAILASIVAAKPTGTAG